MLGQGLLGTQTANSSFRCAGTAFASNLNKQIVVSLCRDCGCLEFELQVRCFVVQGQRLLGTEAPSSMFLCTETKLLIIYIQSFLFRSAGTAFGDKFFQIMGFVVHG